MPTQPFSRLSNSLRDPLSSFSYSPNLSQSPILAPLSIGQCPIAFKQQPTRLCLIINPAACLLPLNQWSIGTRYTLYVFATVSDFFSSFLFFPLQFGPRSRGSQGRTPVSPCRRKSRLVTDGPTNRRTDGPKNRRTDEPTDLQICFAGREPKKNTFI